MKLESGQRALITGASRGLGVEMARSLAEAGLDLLLAARSRDGLTAVASELAASTGRRVTIATVDMADPTSISALAALAGEVDVLVNNAGVETTRSYDERDPAEISHTIAVNLTGPMQLTRAILPGMIRRGRGHVVNVASVAGLLGVPFQETYCATKFGLVGFSRSLRLTARSCRWDVSATALCPGFIDGAGMFEALKQEFGVDPQEMGAAPLRDIGPAVVRAIEEDLPDVIVAEGDVRQFAVLSVADPQAFEASEAQSPSSAMFRSVAEARREMA